MFDRVESFKEMAISIRLTLIILVVALQAVGRPSLITSAQDYFCEYRLFWCVYFVTFYSIRIQNPPPPIGNGFTDAAGNWVPVPGMDSEMERVGVQK